MTTNHERFKAGDVLLDPRDDEVVIVLNHIDHNVFNDQYLILSLGAPGWRDQKPYVSVRAVYGRWIKL